MQIKRVYSVHEVFGILKANKITTNIESVRRWLRIGELEGIEPTSRKEGWKVTHPALECFLAKRLPDTMILLENEFLSFNATNDVKENNATNDVKENNATNIVLDEEAIRANMWFEVTRKNIWEGYVPVNKSLLKEVAKHRHYEPTLVEQVWKRCVENSSAYKQPRVSYLLDAFSFEGQRLLMDMDFSSKEEQIIYAIFEYVKKIIK